MARGRKPNHARNFARLVNALTFTSATACICGCFEHYTSSGACVECSIDRGKVRYATHKDEIAAKDAARYQRKKATRGGA